MNTATGTERTGQLEWLTAESRRTTHSKAPPRPVQQAASLQRRSPPPGSPQRRPPPKPRRQRSPPDSPRHSPRPGSSRQPAAGFGPRSLWPGSLRLSPPPFLSGSASRGRGGVTVLGRARTDGARGRAARTAAPAAQLGLLAGDRTRRGRGPDHRPGHLGPVERPPLLRPTGLTAGTLTTDSVAFHWSNPPTGPLPDKYLILHDGKVIGSVPGTATSYRYHRPRPGHPLRVPVAAERGGKRSAMSTLLAVRTAIPPISAARWQGTWTVNAKFTRGSNTIHGAKHFTDTWLANPTLRHRTMPRAARGDPERAFVQADHGPLRSRLPGHDPAKTCSPADQGPPRSPSGPP